MVSSKHTEPVTISLEVIQFNFTVIDCILFFCRGKHQLDILSGYALFSLPLGQLLGCGFNPRVKPVCTALELTLDSCFILCNNCTSPHFLCVSQTLPCAKVTLTHSSNQPHHWTHVYCLILPYQINILSCATNALDTVSCGA